MASADLGISRTTLAAAAAAGLLTLAVGLSRVPLDGLTGKTVPGGPAVDWLVTTIAMVAGATVGTVLAARRPRNPIGWIVLAVFLLLAAPYNQYLVLAYRQQRGLQPLGWAAVAAANAWPVVLALITLMLWAFPDRRLPAGRRRRVPLAPIVTSRDLGQLGRLARHPGPRLPAGQRRAPRAARVAVPSPPTSPPPSRPPWSPPTSPSGSPTPTPTNPTLLHTPHTPLRP